jgi:hypothetical protein
MQRAILPIVFGSICLGLSACVVAPPPPPPAPVMVAPPVVAPPAVVVAPRPRYWHRRCPPGFHLGRHGHHCGRN